MRKLIEAQLADAKKRDNALRENSQEWTELVAALEYLIKRNDFLVSENIRLREMVKEQGTY